MTGPEPTLFAAEPVGQAALRWLRTVSDSCGPYAERASRTQVSFRRRTAYAWLWRPGLWLHGAVAPAVLSFALPERLASPRVKEAVAPRPGRWMHHVELRARADLDEELAGWVRAAYRAAG